jgi:hypothetical protein
MKTILAIAIAGSLAAGQAHAHCNQVDIGGTWEFYGDTTGKNAQSPTYALRCTLHIDPLTGAMAANSDCESTPTYGLGGSQHGPLLSGGSATLMEPSNCTFTLRFTAATGLLNIRVQALHATLTPSKEVVVGLMGDALSRGDGGGSTFTMARVR